MFGAFSLEVLYDKVDRRIGLSAMVWEAVAKTFPNARDLPKEVSSVTTREVAAARCPSERPSNHRVDAARCVSRDPYGLRRRGSGPSLRQREPSRAGTISHTTMPTALSSSPAARPGRSP